MRFCLKARLTLAPLLLFHRRQDGGRIGANARAGGVPPASTKAAARRVREQLKLDLGVGLATAARVAIEEELHRGRCRTEADSLDAPRRDARARREVPAHPRTTFVNCIPQSRADGRVLRATTCLECHIPCIELLFRRYYERFCRIGRVYMAEISRRTPYLCVSV